MTPLPNGWQEAALGDVCAIVAGATPKTGVSTNWGDDVVWVTPNDLSKDRSQTLMRGERSLTSAGYESCSARTFPAGSVIVSSRAPVGYVAIAGQEMCTNQGCKTAVPPGFLDSRYLYWFLLNAKPDLEARASGTTFKEISKNRFAETRLIWPPLDEQRRIVNILEDHLSRLDAADAYLDASLARAKTWHSKVMEELLWSDDAPQVAVRDLLREPMRNGRSDRAVQGDALGTRALTLTAVTKNAFAAENTKLTTTTAERAASLWLEPGDIFVQRSNTPQLVGTSARYAGPRDWAIFPDLLIRLRPDESRIDGRFLTAVLRSEQGHRQLRRKAKGAAGSMPKIDQEAIGSASVPVPPLKKQRQLLAQAEAAADALARLQAGLAVSRARGRALRRALLTAAFCGRLTGSGFDLSDVEETIGA